MTPEEAVRSYTYCPLAEEPPAAPPHDNGRIERRLAVAFAMLAIFAFAFFLGKVLP